MIDASAATDEIEPDQPAHVAASNRREHLGHSLPERSSLVDVLGQVQDVDGWMTAGQASMLHDCASRCRGGGRIVEIGSFRGRSTIVLSAAADPSVEVIAIDPHAGNDRGPQEIEGYAQEANGDHAAFHENLERAGVARRVRHLRLSSAEALGQVEGAVSLLYVDGAHRFAPARADISAWGQRVEVGGTMLIHDAFSSVGVTMAIMRELFVGGRFRYVGRSRSMAMYRADLGSAPMDRVGNLARQTAQLPWFAKNVGLKVLLTAGLGRVLSVLGRPVPDWPY